MSTHIDLWDMESGNLIDSWPIPLAKGDDLRSLVTPEPATPAG